jgi:hypothetical protein
MSGPIIRSGPSTKFSENWSKVFGKKSSKAGAKAASTGTKAKTAKPKVAKKKTAKKK